MKVKSQVVEVAVPTEVSHIGVLSVYQNGFHTCNRTEAQKREYGSGSIDGGIGFFCEMLEQLIGEHYENIGRRVEITVKVIDN